MYVCFSMCSQQPCRYIGSISVQELYARVQDLHVSHHNAAIDDDGALHGSRESVEVRESTRLVLGDIQEKGVVRCFS